MHQHVRPIQRILATNSSASAFASKVPTLTKPVNDGVLDLANDSGIIAVQKMKLWAVGVGSANDAFSVRVWGWSKLAAGPSGNRDVWIPSVLAELAFILGATTGVAGTRFPATELIADTVTIVTEGTITEPTTRQGNIYTYSPAGDLVAFALVPLQGFELVEFDFDQTTNTPTMNALVSLY